jgi:hypothetical protein
MDTSLDHLGARDATPENVTLGFDGEKSNRKAHADVAAGHDAGEGLSNETFTIPSGADRPYRLLGRRPADHDSCPGFFAGTFWERAISDVGARNVHATQL